MLTITDYKNWATHGQPVGAALNHDATALEAAPNQAGFFARMFNTKSAQAVRNSRSAVMKDFTRALGARYGVTIAQQAITAAGLSQTSELRGLNILSAITAAKQLRAQMLQAPVSSNLRLGNTDVSQNHVGVFLEDKNNVVTKFLKMRAVAVQLLGEFPLCPEDYGKFHDRATALVERLVKLRCKADVHDNIPEGIPPQDFKDGLDSLIKAIYTKDAKSSDFLSGLPLSEGNIQDYKDIWRDSAINAMVALRQAAAARNNANAVSSIDRAIAQLRENPNVINDFNENTPLSKEVARDHVKPFVVNLVKRQLAHDHVRGFKVDAADVLKKIKIGYRTALNQRPWEVVSKTISASVGNRPVELKSTIAPAGRLGHSAGSPRGPIAEGYPDDVNGYMCHTADTNHAVNLAVSSLAVGEPGGAQKLAFSGVRHGVHCAWEIRSDAARAEANKNRAREAVIAAFIAKFDVAGTAEQLPQADENGTTTVNLSMTSVSLLTPDMFRRAFNLSSGSNESRMLSEQNAAWDAIAQEGVDFEYNGRQIHIQPQILKFNFGVNTGAVNWPGFVKFFIGGWDVSDNMNGVAFGALRQEAETFIQNHPEAPRTPAVSTLLEQCRRALEAKAERTDSHDAYKLAARIAVLSQLIGNVPCWNCKSGKDRTGEMDVECKFLSTLIARCEQIPEPGARLTEAQKGLFRSIALEGGNFDIQKMNTGLAGFKTGGVSSIPERLGGKEYRDVHRGGSDHVNV